MKTGKFLRLYLILGAALLGGACILETVGPAAQENAIVVTATPDGGKPAGQDLPSPTFTLELTATFTPSLTHTITVTPVTLKAGQELSCVTGPDWKLYEWVTKIPKDETVTLIARAVPEIPDYYVALTGDGKECWAFGGSSVISGPVASLPVRETPSLPTINFVVRNRVYIDLVDVYIRPAGDSSWGADRLTSPSISTGLEVSFSITAGYYDVRILDPYGHAIYEAYNRAIGADNNYRILEVATDVEFTIRNDFPFSICWIDVQPPGGSWQKLYATEDGGGSIYNGNTRDFTLRAGTYGLRVTRCTGAILLSTACFNLYPGMPTVVLS
jgi:hypothetical protein